MSIFKVARTSQPQGPVGIDWANPITKDLKAAVYVTEGKLCSAINPLIQGTLSKIFTTTPKGLGVTLGSTSNAIGYHTGVSASSNLTNLIYITGFVNTSSTKLMGNYGIGSLVTKTGTGQIICVSVAGGQFGATSSVLSQLPHVIVGTASASLDAVAIFIDGNLEGVGGGGGAPTADDSVGGVLSGGYSTQPFTIVMSLRWSRVLSNIEIKSLSDNPWQIFLPRKAPIFVGLAGPVVVETNLLINSNSFYTHTIANALSTIGRPESDTAAGAWTPSTGTVLADVLKEVVPNDTDYISVNTIATCEIQLNNTAYPGGGTQVLRYRASSVSDSTLTITLKQGATTIMTRTHALTSTIVEYVDALTAPEIASIVAGPITVTLTSS